MPFRGRLDEIDEQIARLLGERFEICREVALHKSEHGIPMMQPGRVAEVRARYLERGAEVDLPARVHGRPVRADDRRDVQHGGRADGRSAHAEPAEAGASVIRPTFITLGPTGTCHENALLRYLEFQGIESFELVLVEDLLDAIEQVRARPHTFLVQCSAHVQVHLVTERYYEEVFVIDTFLYPTKELALLVRTDVGDPRSLGIVSATRGYTDLTRWQTDRSTSPPSRSSRGACSQETTTRG